MAGRVVRAERRVMGRRRKRWTRTERIDPLDDARAAAGLPTQHGTRPSAEPRLDWMCTVEQAAAAMGVGDVELRGLVERHARLDWGDEHVSRLSRRTLTEFLGARMADDASLGVILGQGIVCRRLASWKKDNIPQCFHGPEGETLTDWVVFVRSYEDRPAEVGDTSVSRLPPTVFDGYAGQYLRLRIKEIPPA
jgi:hypothetical protein